MPSKQITRNIALTPHLDRLVQKKVDSGRYQSASEVVREGLRLLEERDAARTRSAADVRRGIEIGWQESEKGRVIDGPSVFAEVARVSKSRRAAQRTRR